MRYILLRSRSLEELEKHVNEKLGHGFKPAGGVATCIEEQYDRDTNTTYDLALFIQAMTEGT